MKRIYLDYASLTPIDKRVERVIRGYNKKERDGYFANPSSIYTAGVEAKKIMQKGRESVASFLSAHSDEIVFTSGGTESNILALEGACRAVYRTYQKALSTESTEKKQKLHIIISSIEHSSIMGIAAMMEKQGCEVTRLSVDRFGLVSLDELKKAIKPNTCLVSVMTVNNEIGVIEPIREIAKVIRHARSTITKDNYPLFHTDASQAALYLELNVEKLGVDMLTLDSIKTYGPRSMGALYIKRGTPLEQITYGGGQENHFRSGTENVAAITGFAKALEIAAAEREAESERLVMLRDYFIKKVRDFSPSVIVNGVYEPGDRMKRVANNINITLSSTKNQIDHEFFLLQLDARGIMCSTKSACLRDEDESYVLRALSGFGAHTEQKKIPQSLRFSLGRFTTKKDIDFTLKKIDEIISL